MAEVQRRREARIKVMACRQIYRGLSSGHTYTIFEIDAARVPDGTVIREKLRAFEPFPVGQEIDVEVEKFESERYGASFRLFPKQSGGGESAKVNELAASVARLAARVEELEKRLNMNALSGMPPPEQNGAR